LSTYQFRKHSLLNISFEIIHDLISIIDCFQENAHKTHTHTHTVLQQTSNFDSPHHKGNRRICTCYNRTNPNANKTLQTTRQMNDINYYLLCGIQTTHLLYLRNRNSCEIEIRIVIAIIEKRWKICFNRCRKS
jgi:hypothetical protein